MTSKGMCDTCSHKCMGGLNKLIKTRETKNTKNMKKLVGHVTIEEKDEILSLYERKNSLTELANILTVDNEDLYEKLVKDLGETSTKFQSWWDRMSEKYQWEGVEGGNWQIDFNTCEIYLLINE